MNDSVQLNLSYRQVTSEMDNCENPEQVLRILQEEISGPNRPAFVNRIYGRYDTMRRAAERLDLAHAAAGTVAPWLRPPAKAAAPAAGKRPGKGAATPVQAPAAPATSGAGRRAGGRK
jgi:hypothetical protein